MKEIIFLKQNAPHWEEFEKLLSSSVSVNPDRLSDLFIRLTDDLAFARTHYPKSKTTEYLNTLAAKAHHKIYRNKKEKGNRFITFWTQEVPLSVYSCRKHLVISLFIFLIAGAIGAMSAYFDETFVRMILGDGYVNQTIENIKNDDPFAVYKQQSEGDMFAFITLNNVLVSFRVYVMAILGGIGTGYMMLYNGIMVGAFQSFFFQYGLLGESFLNVYIHGTLELSAIVIAGGAGFHLASGFMFPGTYSRGTSFTQAAKRSLKVIIGLVPVFITAGFLEGFITRKTEMPDWVKILIISISALFITWYFVILPYLLHLKTTYGSEQENSNN